jgi:Bifunctional DNA primase/polymerase, N-terminal
MSTNALAIARDLLSRGYNPVPVPIGKHPTSKNWQHVVVTDENVGEYFNGKALNVGCQMGPASGGLLDVDLDCIEAVKLAPYFLPPTNLIYGRPGKRKSHWLYICSDEPEPKASIKLTDESKSCIVELRMGGGGKGAQSVWPGSIHPSGERYEFDEDGTPGSSQFAVFKDAAMKIAVATLMARNWPAKTRHDSSLCVGGFLARAGWDVDTIGDFMVAVQEVAGVSDHAHIENGRTAAVDAAKLHLEDGKGFGYPALVELFGEPVAKQIAKNSRLSRGAGGQGLYGWYQERGRLGPCVRRLAARQELAVAWAPPARRLRAVDWHARARQVAGAMLPGGVRHRLAEVARRCVGNRADERHHGHGRRRPRSGSGAAADRGGRQP